VLDWRRTELEMEELKFKGQIAALAELDRARAELEAEGIRAELQVRDWKSTSGYDLAALGSFRLRVQKREREIAAQRDQGQRQLETQQAAMLEARRRFRLLERLRDRRMHEWQAACDREVEETAAESYLSRFSREGPPTLE
jgi:hypothetical protein